MAEMFDSENRVPEAYEENAPHFDDARPEDLPQYLEDIERMMEIDETPEDKKNAFLTRYAIFHCAREWRAFHSYRKSYKEFKKEVIDNYPSAGESPRGSLRKLDEILRSYPTGGITITEQEKLYRLIRALNVEVTKLLAPPARLTNREAVRDFLDKLHPAFEERVHDYLSEMASVQQQSNTDVELEITYTFEGTCYAAKKLAKDDYRQREYFDRLSPDPEDRPVVTNLNARSSEMKREEFEVVTILSQRLVAGISEDHRLHCPNAKQLKCAARRSEP